MRFHTGKTLREILRLRPGAVQVLESEAGPQFWNTLELSLTEFCREHALDRDGIVQRLETLVYPADGIDWKDAPLYELIDFLTANHRQFRERELLSIGAHLEATGQADYPSGFDLADFRNRFHDFVMDFRLHMHEEEEYLFPMSLRLEACTRYPELGPEIYRGSVGAYIGSMLRTPEVEISAMLAVLHGLAAIRSEAKIPALDRLHELVEKLFVQVTRHADLETGILVPRAEGMERLLKSRLENWQGA